MYPVTTHIEATENQTHIQIYIDYSRSIYYLWETNGSFSLSYANQVNLDKIDSCLSLMMLDLQDLLEKT